jgi:hypothetical protein
MKNEITLCISGKQYDPTKYHQCKNALILTDGNESEVCYLHHLFHFLETLIVSITEIELNKWTLESIDAVIVSNFNDDRWKGLGQPHNEWLCRRFFPNVKHFWTLSDIVEHGIVAEKALSIDRSKCNHGSLNKMFLKYIPFFPLDKWRKIILGDNPEVGLLRKRLKVVYINRQNTGRHLSSEEPLLRTIARYDKVIDFHNVRMEDLSFEEQVELVRDADVLLGVHGNGLSHQMFMPPRRYVIEFFPGNWKYNWDYQLMAKCMGHEYFLFQGGELVSHARNIGVDFVDHPVQASINSEADFDRVIRYIIDQFVI